MQFNPVDQADELRKYGGYIPGIRPGPPTAVYLDRVLTRLTLPGLDLPRDRRGAPVGLHQRVQLLAGDLARARRHLGADRRRRRPRHDAPDGVADDDAVLRGLLACEPARPGPAGGGEGDAGQADRRRLRDPAHLDRRHVPRRRSPPEASSGARSSRSSRAGARPGRDHGRADPGAARRARRAATGSSSTASRATSAQAVALDEMLAGIGRRLDAILFFDLPDEVATERMLERAEEENRPDDTPEVIAQAARDLPRRDRADRRALPPDRASSCRSTPSGRSTRSTPRSRTPSTTGGCRVIIRKSPARDRADGRRRRGRRRHARAARGAARAGDLDGRARPDRRRVHPLAGRRPDLEGLQAAVPAATCISPNDDDRPRHPGRLPRPARATSSRSTSASPRTA